MKTYLGPLPMVSGMVLMIVAIQRWILTSSPPDDVWTESTPFRCLLWFGPAAAVGPVWVIAVGASELRPMGEGS